jgi:hypothetical protein
MEEGYDIQRYNTEVASTTVDRQLSDTKNNLFFTTKLQDVFTSEEKNSIELSEIKEEVNILDIFLLINILFYE